MVIFTKYYKDVKESIYLLKKPNNFSRSSLLRKSRCTGGAGARCPGPTWLFFGVFFSLLNPLVLPEIISSRHHPQSTERIFGWLWRHAAIEETFDAAEMLESSPGFLLQRFLPPVVFSLAEICKQATTSQRLQSTINFTSLWRR